MRRVFGQLAAAAIAVLILYVATPFLPTTLLIQPVSLTVDDGVLVYTRTVTIPIVAQHQTEITQGHKIFPQCNAAGTTLFEERGLTPIVWEIPCDLLDGTYGVTICVTADWFGLQMQPACLTTEWEVGDGNLKSKVDMIQRQVDTLEEEIKRAK